MKKQYKIILIVCLVLAGLAAAGWSMMKPLAVDTETVAAVDLGTEFEVQGTLLPRHSELLNSGSNGVVEEIPYQPGTSVSQGTVILRMGYESQADLEIQRELYRQQLASARQTYDRLFGVNGTAQSAYETARSDYELAEQNFQNGRVLASAGNLSQMDLKGLENQRNRAKQALIQAEEEKSDSNRAYYEQLTASYEKQLNTMESAVTPGEIVMPYDGVLWEVYQEEGAYAAANQPVIKIYQPQDMKIQASLLTEDAAQLEPGQMVVCEFADGTAAEGEVQFISTVAGQTLSTIGMEENRCIVEVKPQQVPDGAGAGHQVSVTFSLIAAEQVLAVSSSALVPMSGGAVLDGSGVYVIEQDKAVLKMVETGKKSGGKVEVLAGLEAGDVVISDPYEDGVKAGKRVKSYGTQGVE